MNGITLTLKLGILDHLIFSKIQLYEEKNYLFSVHDTLGAKLLTRLRLKFSRLKMNINLDMVLMIQLIQCVLAELKLKPLNISSCDVIYTLP